MSNGRWLPNEVSIRSFHLHETCQLSLFATSRHIPDIEEKCDSSMRLDIRASDRDVERYLDGRISQLPGYVRKSTDLQNEVKTAIIKAVDGMFLLARLNFDSLRGKKVMRNALNRLPTGSDAYRDAYKDAMERIEGQLDDERDLAKPLTTAELQEAIAVEVNESKLDETNFFEISTMISVKIIRLVHYTTQEYFERTRDDWSLDAETFITTICVTYLSFETFNTGFCLTLRDFVKRVQSNKLSTYAAPFWGLHAGKASIPEKALEHALLRFLENQAKVDASWQLVDSHDLLELHVGQGPSLESSYSYYSYSRFSSRGLTGMHITAFFGLETVIQLLLYSGKLEVDSRDSPSERVFSLDFNIINQGQTPLSYAVESGHEKVVKLLLDTGKVEVDSENAQGQTSLYRAAKFGNEKVVKLLLDTGKVEIDTINKLDETPLLGAVRNGHESIVKLLLNTGAVNINQSNYKHRTPISYAAESGFESMVKLFLNTNSVDISFADKYHRTPISYAAQFGSESMVNLLLDTGKIDIGYQDDSGLTSFSYACLQRSGSIMKLLLDAGKVDLNHKDDNGMTPFWLAASAGCEAVVKQILNTNEVDLKCEMDYWVCPENAWWDHEEIVKLLIKKYADIKMDIPPEAEHRIRKEWPGLLETT
ncbi:hypothetical protein BCON_0274g00130 [Botryotinia convoluta]|uniref:Uncharacterized protein n=1 Tax=Botryotinia convoluta TaxID=54673 RepID=A0A4Z1HEY0_9HELO|nr:hypothetical protein BCON_0274g00130 [Botryotinia convoluta]